MSSLLCAMQFIHGKSEDGHMLSFCFRISPQDTERKPVECEFNINLIACFSRAFKAVRNIFAKEIVSWKLLFSEAFKISLLI